MMNPKYFFLILSSIFILEVQQAKAASEMLRNADGRNVNIHQYDAMKACPKGTHLPTIRELAKESQARGAAGILEISQVSPDKVPAGYVKIFAVNPDKQKDEFYFSFEGYKRPDGDLGSYWFWSSSYDSINYNDAYGLNGLGGGIGSINRYHRDRDFIAVLCVSDL